MKKIITSLILLFGVLSTLFAANATLYYVNSTKWATVNGYVWNNTTKEELATWPGTAMTKTSETAKGFDVYSYTFDAAKYDRIIFNGNGKTGDLTFSTSKPYYYEGAWYATLAEINGADAPAELTLYYVNTTKWSKVNAYAWIDGGAPLSAWPGAAATLMDKTVSGNQVYSYTFNPAMANLIIFNDGESQTEDLTIDATTPYYYNKKWVASVTFDATPVDPTPIYEPIYLRGNVNAWGVDDNWKLTTTDGNYFVANYAAGSEVELSGSFKLGSGTTDWTPYNFGADIEVEAGKSYILIEGGDSPNINTSGKIKVSKIEFTLSTKTLKITGQTVADKFDVTTDQGIALVENLDGTLQYIPLTFQANGVYTGVYEFAKSETSMPLFKVGGTADLNTIDFGDNGTSIIRLDQPYTLKRGSFNFVAIDEADLTSQGVDNGTKFDVTVTFTEDWGVTLLFVKQANPVVKITNLHVDAFANTTVNTTSIVSASYYLYNADEAVPTISGEDAAYFTLSDITLGEEFSSQDGEPMRGGEMIITFAPTEGRQYIATLTITSGDVSESIALIATGVALPEEAITNLTIPAFASTEVYASSVVTATYTLENATQATARLTGDNAFSIVEQTVSNGQGAVTISFTPGTAGTYSATLIITSGKASQSIDFTATATAPETDERVATLYIQEDFCNPRAIYVYGSETATIPEGDAKTGVIDDKLYLHGYNMYKITLNLTKTKYVSISDKGYNKQAIEPGSTWYYDKGWNDNFDECRYDVALEDLTKQPEAGKIYSVDAYLAFYSAEYGPEFMYKADRTDYDATIKGVTYYSYDIDASLYDMARVEGGDDYSIDWSKPYYYDGNWYATMAQIPVADNLVEKAYWSFGLSRDGNYESGVYPTTHMGNNIYTGNFHISIGIDKPYQWEALRKLGQNYTGDCHGITYADAVVPEQAGYYEVSVQYNATTNQYTAQWEFKETNVFVEFLDKTNAMEIAGLNNYTFRCFTKIAKGLYYYNINDKNHYLTTEETVVQIPEDGAYNITFSYDATTGKFSHTVEKAPSQEITLYYVNENTNVDCAYAFAYAWIQYSGDFVAEYPGEEMTDTGKTVDGYQVFSYTVDLAEADYILFNNTICGDKTADLAIDPAKPYYYQGEWHESLTFDEAPTGETTLYYVNKMGITDTEWDYAFAYAYDNATGTPIVSWPGAPMGKLTKTIDGYDVFACTVDLSKADYIIFTNGQGGSLSQTMDLKIEPLKPYYYELIWHGKLTFDDGTTEPGEILDPVLPDHEPIYLRGVVNNWGVDENYKLTSIDGIRYSVTYAPGSEIELYGNFKLASGNDEWSPFNFGAYPTQPIITAGQDFVALRDASDNIQVDGKILVSKIEFNLDTYTLKITGETQKFDMTSDQGVSVVVYVGEESTFIPLTFTENGTYTGSFTVTDADFSLKIAGTSDYNTINYGTNGTSAKFAYLYALKQGAFESITIEDEYEVGDVINVLVAFEEDWSAIMNLNRQAPMPDDGYEPLYLRAGVTSWAADENFKLTTIDGNYYSAYYEAGSEVEITGAFKIGSGTEDWTPYNFGGNFLVKTGENYILQSGGGDLEADGKIIASKIEFFMATKTLKITGETQENKFDVTTDQGVSLAVNINEETTFIPLTFTQNGTYTGSYTVTDLDFMFKVGGEADFNTINYGTNGTPLILGTPYTLYKNAFESIIVGGDIQVGDVLDVVVSIGEDWITANMLVTKQTTPVDPDDENITLYYVNNEMWAAVNAYAWIAATGVPVVTWPGTEATLLDGTVDGYTVYSYTFERALADYIIFNDGNGSQTDNLAIDATKPYYYDGVWYESLTFDTEPVDPVYPAIYLRGGVTSWAADENYKLTTTDGDYFVATYPAGSEVEISGSFKLGSGNANWTPYNFGGGFDIEEGKSYILVAGSQSTNLNATGKIMASKIEFTLSTQTLIITGVTQENKFDVTTDQGVSLVAFVGKQQEIFNGLTFTANGVYTGTYTIPEGEFFLKVAGAENYNIIDFGWNGNFIVLDEPYALKQGESNAAAIYPGDWKAGDVLDVQVTFTEDWTATLLLTKQEKPIDPDDPEIVISNLVVPAFAETLIEQEANVTATFTIENASEAEAVIVEDEAGVFSAATPVIDGTAGSVVVTFAPTAAGTYTATLTITAAGVSQSVAITATAVEPQPEVVISNLTAATFAETTVSETADATATFTIENATQAEAVIVEDEAGVFSAATPVIDGTAGSVVVTFAPTAAGTYTATLTITAAGVSQSVAITATAVEPQPEVVISNLTAATFAETTVSETADVTATFTIENASEAEAVIVEDEAGVFSAATPVIDGTAGSVVVTFAPTVAGTYTATLTITAAGVSQSVAITATAVEAVTPVDLSYVVAGNGSEGWLNGIEWDPQAADNAMTDADSDGIYEITYSQVPAGTYSFKVVANTDADRDWLGYGSLDTDNSSKNIPVVGSEENIGFTLDQTADVTIQFNTLTGKIILTTPSGSFATVKIEYFHIRTSGDECLDEFQFTAENGNKVVFQQPAFENTDGTFAVSCGIIGNCNYAVYEKHLYTLVAQGGNYTVTVQFNGDYENPEFTISAELIEVPTITSFSILSDGNCSRYTFNDTNNNTVIISQNVQLEAGETSRDLTFEVVGNCDVNAYYDVLRTTVSESGVYDVTIQFNGDYENPSFSIAATKGAMYLMGGFNNWAASADYKLTTVDGDYFAIEYAQGQEVELSGGFKIASADWGVYDYGKSEAMGNVEAGVGYTLELYGDNLTIADKILVSKVEFTLSTGSFLITGVAQENKFDTTTDQGIALVEFNAGIPTYNVLDFTANGVYTGTYTYSGDNVSFKVGGATDLNTMDYGYNGSDIVIDEAYIMQRFAYNNAALAADTDVLPGDVFNVTVTVTEDWGVTLLLTVKSQVPRPAITNLNVQPCGEVTVGEQGIFYATFNVENITEVSAVITGQGAQAFTVGTPVIVDAMMGYVAITFTPEQADTYTIMLTISSGKAVESVEITATAVSGTPTAIQDAKALGIYATNGTVYAEGEFTIYTLAGLNVTQQNGALEGVYIVSTDKGNAMISVW